MKTDLNRRILSFLFWVNEGFWAGDFVRGRKTPRNTAHVQIMLLWIFIRYFDGKIKGYSFFYTNTTRIICLHFNDVRQADTLVSVSHTVPKIHTLYCWYLLIGFRLTTHAHRTQMPTNSRMRCLLCLLVFVNHLRSKLMRKHIRSGGWYCVGIEWLNCSFVRDDEFHFRLRFYVMLKFTHLNFSDMWIKSCNTKDLKQKIGETKTRSVDILRE